MTLVRHQPTGIRYCCLRPPLPRVGRAKSIAIERCSDRPWAATLVLASSSHLTTRQSRPEQVSMSRPVTLVVARERENLTRRTRFLWPTPLLAIAQRLVRDGVPSNTLCTTFPTEEWQLHTRCSYGCLV